MVFGAGKFLRKGDERLPNSRNEASSLEPPENWWLVGSVEFPFQSLPIFKGAFAVSLLVLRRVVLPRLMYLESRILRQSTRPKAKACSPNKQSQC